MITCAINFVKRNIIILKKYVNFHPFKKKFYSVYKSLLKNSLIYSMYNFSVTAKI